MFGGVAVGWRIGGIRPVGLQAMKANPALAGLEMIRQGRLSVSPVRDAEWAAILKMAGE